MDRININLLPPELKEYKKREKKRGLIIRLSIGLLVIMVVITASLLVSVVLQNRKIVAGKQKLETTRVKVNAFKQKEALAVVLKTQIDDINSLITKEFPQSEAFNLINSLTPPRIRVYSFSINKSNKIILQGETTDTLALETFFNNLVDPKFNEGKISKVVVDSLNRDKDAKMRFDLTITSSTVEVPKPTPSGSPEAQTL